MNKKTSFFYTAFFLLLTLLILTHSKESLYYALNGLNLWFTKMIPGLLPFMILSGIMVRMGLTEQFTSLLYPFLNPLLKVRRNVCYAVIMGFLCGFPMGARVTADLLEQNMITHKEAQFLLAFCNNIGPVYFCSFVLPLLHRSQVFPYMLGMYGIPFLYGMILRRTAFRSLTQEDCCIKTYSSPKKHAVRSPIADSQLPKAVSELQSCSTETASAQQSALLLLEKIDDSIMAAIQSILTLGGYMILFNLLNLVPEILLTPIGSQGRQIALLLSPILEITGGLGMLGDRHPLIALLLLPFGGLSCIAQTYSMIKHTGLSIYSYVLHKIILTFCTCLYYLGWFVLFQSSFLR